jgi:hypothetical protein
VLGIGLGGTDENVWLDSGLLLGCCVAVIISPPAPELKVDPLLLPQLAVD